MSSGLTIIPWASELQGSIIHLCWLFESGRDGEEVVLGSVEDTRALSWRPNTAGPFLPSELKILSTAPDLTEFPTLATTTYKEFSGYSSSCNLLPFISLKQFFPPLFFANVIALQSWLLVIMLSPNDIV